MDYSHLKQPEQQFRAAAEPSLYRGASLPIARWLCKKVWDKQFHMFRRWILLDAAFGTETTCLVMAICLEKISVASLTRLKDEGLPLKESQLKPPSFSPFRTHFFLCRIFGSTERFLG